MYLIVHDYWQEHMRIGKAEAMRMSFIMTICLLGMALYYDCDAVNAYEFSRFCIDERYQGKGFGIEAARHIIEIMKSDGKYDRVILCYIDGNEAAKNMYEKLGFYLTGDCDGDEIMMEKVLK